MGLFGEKFEHEERTFVKEVMEKGVLAEDVAKIRLHYGKEFSDRESFENFKKKVNSLKQGKTYEAIRIGKN